MRSPPLPKKAGGPREEAAQHSFQTRPKHTPAGPDCKPRFDREQLDSMRGRLPEYLAKTGLDLHKQGTRQVCRCPKHEDTSPSFAVFAGGQACGCYPCNFQGDIFATAEWLGRAGSFPEAVSDVAAVLGVTLPQGHAPSPSRPAQAQQRPAPQPAPPFTLPESDREKIHAARLAFTDAFHGGNPIVDEIAESLGLTRETLRRAAWGSCGLGLANGWLCYAYPSGLKWRNPHPKTTPRFRWLVGKATEPWRMEWTRKPGVSTVFLTEGESDALALIECGIEADGAAAVVASPGTSFPAAWAPLFTDKLVVLCFDTDAPGQAAAVKVAGMLRPFAAAVSIWKGGQP